MMTRYPDDNAQPPAPREIEWHQLPMPMPPPDDALLREAHVAHIHSMFDSLLLELSKLPQTSHTLIYRGNLLLTLEYILAHIRGESQ